MKAEVSPAASVIDAVQKLVLPLATHEEIEQLVAKLKQVDVSEVTQLKPLRVKILGSITTDYLADHVRFMLVRGGFRATVEAGQYGGLVRGLLGETDLSSVSCDAAVLLLNHRDIQFPPSPGLSAADARDLVTREVEFWTALFVRSTVPTVILSFDLPSHRILDEQDGLAPGGLGWHIRMTNLDIAARLPATVSLVDAEALQRRVGAANWHDDRLYNLCKQPYAMEALPEIAQTLVAALTGLMGRSRKVLVLDLDNTLWGGVIGDDGLQGIELGPETAEGEAFVHFQTYVKNLSRRGIILAVCSKNRDEAARSPFREHSAMVLKEEDISCFVANFDDKAANLRHIARTLNLGTDSLVFVDDNPVERALIRVELPEVLVVELPEDPAYYLRALEASKAFPLRTLTAEDLGRVASYRAMSAFREATAAAGTDIDHFLRGLEPTVCIERVDSTTVDRIVQLIKKTNQFKLNPSTFEEDDILGAADNIIALRLSDRLQDYGVVAVAVTKLSDGVLEVLNWVMSCRVFGRRLENVMLERFRASAEAHNCSVIRAAYTPSTKNVILPEILTRIGFTADEAEVFSCPSHGAIGEPHYMTIIKK